MQRKILEEINFKEVTPRELVEKLKKYRDEYDCDDIFLDGDTKAICMDVCEGNWR